MSEESNSIRVSLPAHNTPREANRINLDIPGELTRKIGSGKHAQASLVYYAIVYSFLIGLILSGGAYFLIIFKHSQSPYTDTLVSIWGIFVPIITLSLGYIFGKNE